MSLSLGPRTPFPVQSLLPSSNMAQCRLSGQVSEGVAGGARVKQDLRLLFEAAGSGPVSG